MLQNKELWTNINKKVGRTTAFTFIYYPTEEEASDNFTFLFNILDNFKVPVCVSPLHCFDINEIDTDTGEIEYKKSHFHIVVDFGSGQNKTVKQCFELIEPIRDHISIAPFENLEKLDQACDIWKRENCVRNMRTLLRYFKHLDNPEKHQYIEIGDDYRTFGGFELDDRIYSQSDSYRILDEIFDFIDNNEVYSFCDLIRYCRKNNREWFSVICRNQFSNLIINYIKSFTYQNTGALDKKIEKYEEQV